MNMPTHTHGRPAGDVRRAVLLAAVELNRGDHAATLREMAHRACVGYAAARATVRNLRRDGWLAPVRTRVVDYRNRPVFEYAPVCPLPDTCEALAPCSGFSFTGLQAAWA